MKMKRKFNLWLVIVAFTFLFTASAKAETWFAYLSSAQEVPTNASTATGFARVFLNETAGTITFTVTFTGLSSAQTASHIHAPAAIGANTGVAINFGAVGGTAGTITGTVAITPTQIAQIRAHQGYVNVHSTNFAGGEIRGQLGVKRPVDFDGDGRNDYSVLRWTGAAAPQPMAFWNQNSTGGTQISPTWGDASRDFPVPGDYDGDGKDDFALFRAGAATGDQSEFWILTSNNFTVLYYAWGRKGSTTGNNPSDTPIARDFDGDGKTDVAVARRGAQTGDPLTWYIRNSSTNTARVENWGITGADANTFYDAPIPGDYDGDGKFDLAIYRFGTAPDNSFIVKKSSDGGSIYQLFGNFTTDYILPGDYDGDGKYDFAVARTGATSTSPMVWWILNSSNGTTRTQTFGITSDLPAQGDYDGDARTDLAIYRPGAAAGNASNFWVLRSFDNTAQVTQWGINPNFAVNTFDAR